ncbi:MFS transporter [Caldimonas caldifontis]|uniref:MFS transporter n=1 Tax=Caldimonas caldifontis TaxID=1452508 RepID=A0A2S5SU52_9BURK|nr:MFS transporter [Caldimonas caldifontis]PPE66270.1 MFS transporter [Caldimonas caldifontis]
MGAQPAMPRLPATAASAADARAAAGWTGAPAQGLSYGALGLPLAFVALPLYVVLPAHYAAEFGVPLALLGAVLLGARLADALMDPWIGRVVDQLFHHSARRVWLVGLAMGGVLAAGFAALFFPPVQGTAALLAWCAALLLVTYFSYSALSVTHQAWGAMLGGGAGQRAGVVAWREGFALVGVLVASVLPSVAGMGVTATAFAVLLAVGLWALGRAPQPRSAPVLRDPSQVRPWRVGGFRRLLLIYLLNGIASAIPATLVLFFIRDRLQAAAYEPLFLALYFAAAALAVPLWVRAVARFGLAPSWLAGMLLAVAAFVWAATLGRGDVLAYALVCAASGIALGADLTLPPALLAGVIQRAGHQGRSEGAYFGWWNFATKLNLALAAGLALPLLQLAGYEPGTRDAQGLAALTLAYCLLPCVLKLAAAGALYGLWMRHDTGVER